MDLNYASTINLTAGYNWVYHKKNEFFLEFGYAVRMQHAPYFVKDGSMLSDRSKAIIKIIQPGGIIFGLGLNFGL